MPIGAPTCQKDLCMKAIGAPPRKRGTPACVKREASEATGAPTCGREAQVMPTGAPMRSIGVSTCEERRREAYRGRPYTTEGAYEGIGAPPYERGEHIEYIGPHCTRKGGACETYSGASDGHGALRPAAVRPNRGAYMPNRGKPGKRLSRLCKDSQGCNGAPLASKGLKKTLKSLRDGLKFLHSCAAFKVVCVQVF